MAQQGSLYQDHGSWYVRYWEAVRNEDGTTRRKNPAHRLASVKDYPKKSEVIPLKNRFMDRLNHIGFTPGSGVSFVDFVDNTFLPGVRETAYWSRTQVLSRYVELSSEITRIELAPPGRPSRAHPTAAQCGRG